uniref:WW domain-containing protein n=1 Tax=Macrostomum lignano TaxID=282301 RepID=A0A1I8FPA6_9PLAT
NRAVEKIDSAKKLQQQQERPCCKTGGPKKWQLQQNAARPKVRKCPARQNSFAAVLLLPAVAISRSSSIAVKRREVAAAIPLPPGSGQQHCAIGPTTRTSEAFRRSVSGGYLRTTWALPYARPACRQPCGSARRWPLDAPIGLSYRSRFDGPSSKPKSCYFWPMSKSSVAKFQRCLYSNSDIESVRYQHPPSAYFGGTTPSRLTIFWRVGWRRCRSGRLHMLAAESQKYFSRAIMNSGSALAYWASEDQARADTGPNSGVQLKTATLATATGRELLPACAPISPEKIQAKLYPIVLRRGRLWRKINEKRVPTSNRYQSLNRSAEQPDRAAVVLFLPAATTGSVTEFYAGGSRISVQRDNMKKTDLMLARPPQQIPGVVKNERRRILDCTNLSQQQVAHTVLGGAAPIRQKGGRGAPEKGDKHRQRVEKDPPMILAKNLNPLIVDSLAFEYQLPSPSTAFNHWTSKDVLYAFDELTGDNTFKCPVIDFAEFYLRFLGEEGQLREQLLSNPNQPEGTRNIQEHIMTWPPYRMGNTVAHCAGEVKQAPAAIKSARICGEGIPCITEPKKSTQNISGGVQGDRSRQLKMFAN